MTNGSRYNYWKIKGTGEKRSGKTGLYKCQGAWEGAVHPDRSFYRADKIEPIVFRAISEYIGQQQEKEDIFEEIESHQQREKKAARIELEKEKQEAPVTDGTQQPTETEQAKEETAETPAAQ